MSEEGKPITWAEAVRTAAIQHGFEVIDLDTAKCTDNDLKGFPTIDDLLDSTEDEPMNTEYSYDNPESVIDELKTELKYAQEAFCKVQEEIRTLIGVSPIVNAAAVREAYAEQAQRLYEQCQRLEYQLHLLTK